MRRFVEVSVDECLTPELEGPLEFGGEAMEQKGFSIRIADRPVPLKLRRVLKRATRGARLATMPTLRNYEALYEQYELWLVPHRLRIVRRDGRAEVVSVGLEVEYTTEETTCSVVDLLPERRYIEHGSLACRGTITASGGVTAASTSEQAPTSPYLGSGLRFGAAAEGQVSFQFAAAVCTPNVPAGGIGSRCCEWRFDMFREPLFGRDIECCAVVALSKWQEELPHKVRCYVVRRTLWVPTRWQGPWVSLDCPLR